ncbi:MAG TPA: hypothetical protein VG963_03150, partial [Polyangiaceae bacterium]|nr:hypothetical protein [Polyangiaceae bacterium]
YCAAARGGCEGSVSSQGRGAEQDGTHAPVQRDERGDLPMGVVLARGGGARREPAHCGLDESNADFYRTIEQ